MKKIAVATQGNQISEHFGYCEGFTIYSYENEKLVNKEFVESPGHKPGFLPKFLGELSVNVIIAGGMGESAQKLFNENQIEVVVGASGVCDEAAKEYAQGKLRSTGSVCKEHNH